MDRGVWWATVHGVAKNWTWLSALTNISWKPQGHPGKSLTATNPNLHVRKARASKAYWQEVQGHTVSRSKAKTEDWSRASRSHTVYIWVWASFPVGAVLCIPGCLAASLIPTHWMPVPPSCDNWKCLQGLPWWFSVVEISPSNAGVQVRSLVGELGSHVPLSQKTKTWNRDSVVTNSVKTLKQWST